MGTLPEGEGRPRAPTRAIVVHASDVIRAGLLAVFAREPDIEVVGSAASIEGAIRSLPAAAADVILLDLDLPGVRGWAACAEMVRRAGGAGVIVLANSVEDTLILTCLRAGAIGFLRRDASAADILAAVRAASRGEPAFSPAVVGRLAEWARHSKVPTHDERLGPHEVEAVSLVAQGLKTREMAERMGVSESTVKLYLRSAMRKLGVRGRSSAVVACMKQGVI